MHVIHFLPTNLRRVAIFAAQQDASLLIVGSSGTGKVSLAEWVHLNSPRAGRSFYIARAERSLSEQIVEAQSGMLLIEEFTRFPKEQLLLLLDYLKHRSVKSKEHPNLRIMANTRIVCTSSEIANKEIWRYEGVIRSLVGFLEIRMDVPRLCRRMDEFESIAIELLKEICVELQKQHVLGFDAQAMLKLKQYLWPGNIRELRNVLKMAAMVTQTDQIQLFDLPEFEMNTTLFQANRENFEKAYILELLRTFEWDIQKTAERIRMNKDDLLFKIQHYGIDFEQENSKLLKS